MPKKSGIKLRKKKSVAKDQVRAIPTLQELRAGFKPIRNVNAEQRQRLGKLQKFALWITNHVGTGGFFLVIFIWTVGWLSWNVFAPKAVQFDPFPAFVLWLFMSNMIQLFLLPLIMIGQNFQGHHAEARAEADFDVNTRAESEIETILMHLENQNSLILNVLARLDKKK